MNIEDYSKQLENLSDTQKATIMKLLGIKTDSRFLFIDKIIEEEFGELFSKKGRYQMMFESDNYLVYFQSFNKPTDKLWYRVTSNALNDLKRSSKESYICLINPAEELRILLPLKEVTERAKKTKWGTMDYFEINIALPTARWIELDWNLSGYVKKY